MSGLENTVIGITGIDTRSLTNLIRDKGAPKGTISFNKKNKFNIKKLIKITQMERTKNLDLAKKVTTKKSYVWQNFKTWKKSDGFLKNTEKSLHVVAIDYGVKKNILRYFSDFKCKVTIVSCETSAAEIIKENQVEFFYLMGLVTQQRQENTLYRSLKN